MAAHTCPSGIIAIIRLKTLSAPDEILAALNDGGIRSIEVTLPTPDSITSISRWHSTGVGNIGAGTVRTAADASNAVAAGAQFLVTPTTNMDVLAIARASDIPVVCGALTPTEVDSAHQAGAALVKLFPIDSVGGIAYLKAISAPLDDIRFVPTGGIDPDAAQRYAAFGCAAVGVGSALVDEATVAARDWKTIRERALRFTEAWQKGIPANA